MLRNKCLHVICILSHFYLCFRSHLYNKLEELFRVERYGGKQLVLAKMALLLFFIACNCCHYFLCIHRVTPTFNRPLWQYGCFPFNKNSGLKFRKFYVFNGTVHSGCIDPTQATTHLVIVLASRIQKSDTGDNNFVQWKGTFRSHRLKRPDRSKRTTFKAGPEYSGQTKPKWSVPFDVATEITGILGWMESVLHVLCMLITELHLHDFVWFRCTDVQMYIQYCLVWLSLTSVRYRYVILIYKSSICIITLINIVFKIS